MFERSDMVMAGVLIELSLSRTFCLKFGRTFVETLCARVGSSHEALGKICYGGAMTAYSDASVLDWLDREFRQDFTHVMPRNTRKVQSQPDLNTLQNLKSTSTSHHTALSCDKHHLSLHLKDRSGSQSWLSASKSALSTVDHHPSRIKMISVVALENPRLTACLTQEQETFERQEGSQEENPRSLYPKRLVFNQSSFDLQPERVCGRLEQNNEGTTTDKTVPSVGKTLVNRTTGLKSANDALKGRIFEVSLADLQNDEDHAFRKVKLRVDEVQGKNCLTNFHGLDFTSDKLRSLVRKWQTLIEANVTVKTTDDYLLRLFAIAFTKRRPNQIKKTTYAASSQIRAIRKKMTEIIQREATSVTLAQLTGKLIPEVIGREIEKSTQGIYPLQNVHIRKVKLLKAPKFDLGALLGLHGESTQDDSGAKVEREFKEPTPLESV